MMSTKNFFDFFPPPQFLTMPHVGLSISDSAVRFVELKKVAGGATVLHRFAEKSLAPGVVKGGYVHNTEELVKTLRDLRKEYRLEFIKMTLPEEKAYLFKTDIPKVASHEIRNTLEFKIEENVPLSATQVVFDYHALPTRSDKKNAIEVIVSVLPLKVVLVYIDVLKSAGLTALSFEVESQAIADAVVEAGDKRTYLILYTEKSRVGLYVVSNNLVQFTSNINLDEDLAAGSVMSFSYDATRPSFLSKKMKKDAGSDVQSYDLYIKEIHKIYDYWSTYTEGQFQKEQKIQKIILCGEIIAELGNLKDTLAATFAVPVENAHVWTNAFSLDQYVPEISSEASLAFAAPISLALRAG